LSHDSHHKKENFIQKYIFSVDHKIIGLQYGITSLLFLLFGFSLMLIMRWQLAYPETPVPLIGSLLGETGILLPEIYNSLGAMHGTILIFLAEGFQFLPINYQSMELVFLGTPTAISLSALKRNQIIEIIRM
jgi:heme/copper-type cytochrome/quinol oxidase subunit 1